MIRLLAIFICWSVLGAASTANFGALTVTWGGSGGTITPPEWVPDNWGSGDTAFSIEFVTVGDPGNQPTTNYVGVTVGQVNYPYRIAKYEISEHQMDRARIAGGLPITLSTLGTNMPATLVTQYEMAVFANWLNVSAGFAPAYNIGEDGLPSVWPEGQYWTLGKTNLFRHAECFYFLPDWDELEKAARYKGDTAEWFDYYHGSNDAPTPVNGFFQNGSTSDGTAVYAQEFDSRYPEWNSTNTVNVVLTTSGGAVTGIAFSSWASGFNTSDDTTTVFKVVQGGITNATARAATWQTVEWVPGTLTNYVAGTGYTDGPGTITLSGDTVNVTLFTVGGGVVGAIPTGGKFSTEDYSTELDIVQAGGSGAKCKVMRYAPVRVPATWTIVSGGSGYSDGAGMFTSHAFNYASTSPIHYYGICIGAAEVDKAGGPSYYGVYGLMGNVTDCSETQSNIVDDHYVNEDPRGQIRYYGGWWFRQAAVLKHGGNDTWATFTPTPSSASQAYGNGCRIASKVLP